MPGDFRAVFVQEPKFTAVFSSSDDFAANMGNVTRVTTGNYNELTNKPRIEGVELVGNKTFPELGMDKLTNAELENLLNI